MEKEHYWMTCREDEFKDYRKVKVGDKMTYYQHIDGKSGCLTGILKPNRALPRNDRERAVKAMKKGISDLLGEFGAKRTITTVTINARKVSVNFCFAMENMPTKEEMSRKVEELQAWVSVEENWLG